MKEPLPTTPSTLSWNETKNWSEGIINTPDVASVYMMNLTLKHQIKLGGIPYLYEMAKKKTSLLYDLIDNSKGFYHNFIDPQYRSNINVFFRIGKTPEMEKKFIAQAKEKFNI